MQQEEVKSSFTSSNPGVEYNLEVTLDITAYFRDSEVFDSNTLTFHCNPMGSNYRSSYLQVTFDDWSKVVDIRNFLADCFSDNTLETQAMTIEIKDGSWGLTPFGGPPREDEGLEEMTLEVSGERIEFYRSGILLPYIFTYEEKLDGEPQDQNNAEKLLDFFDKIISLHPDFDTGQSASGSPDVEPLFNQHKVKSLLTEIVATDADLFEDYEKAVREFEDGEYADSVRDVGRAAEKLVEMTSLEVHSEGDLPSNTGRQINALDKSTDGLPSFIGKTISPLWWLRNRASHPSDYEISGEEALYALICFQIASEKLLDEHLDI